jgi:AcrR family transcriptional regulator
MRADARRNYERLLTEARLAFTEHGVDTSLEEVARRCGVGIGTLYRHFPTREAMVEAVVREEFDALAAHAGELLTAADPLAALHEWLRAFVGTVGRYRGLTAALLSTLQDETSGLHAACEAMRGAGATLLTRARQAGHIRPDADAVELFALAAGVAWANEQFRAEDRGRVERLLDIVVQGVRAPPIRP